MPRAGAHALLTRPPLGAGPKPSTPFDLHVLGAPPAFVLSQDQTLSFIFPTREREPGPAAHVLSRTQGAQPRPPPPGEHPGLGITSANPQRPKRPRGPSSATRRLAPADPQRPPAGQRPADLKGNDQGPLRRFPKDPPGSPPSVPKARHRKKPRHLPRDAPRTGSPIQAAARASLPASHHHVKQHTPGSRPSDLGDPSAATPQRDPLYSQFAPAAQGTFYGNPIR
jgi:hypothetical protein